LSGESRCVCATEITRILSSPMIILIMGAHVPADLVNYYNLQFINPVKRIVNSRLRPSLGLVALAFDLTHNFPRSLRASYSCQVTSVNVP
jgi:hypothetical protein